MTYEPKHASIDVIDEVITYDPFAKIVINASENFYNGVEPTIVEAHQVTSTFNNFATRTKRVVKLENQIEKVRDHLIENYDVLGDHADEIAELLDIELTNEVTVDVNVTFSVTMTLPVGIEADDVDGHDFSFDITSDNSDYEVQDYDTFVVYCNEG